MSRKGSIKSQLVILMVIILLGMAFSFINQIKELSVVLNEEKTFLNKEISDEVMKYVNAEVQDILMSISTYITNLEEEIDKNMLNCALWIKEIDTLKGDLTMDDINYIHNLTNMSDIYVSDENGVFIYSTEEEAFGLSIYDIDPAYKKIMDEEVAYMPSDFRLKIINQSIFKFTTIARPDGRGLIQTGYDSDNLENSLNAFISELNGIEELYLVDKNNIILTQNTIDNVVPSHSKGTEINNREVKTAFDLKTSAIKLTEDLFEVIVPIKDRDGNMKYALYAKINANPYMSILDTIDKPLEVITLELERITNQIIINTLIVILILVIFIPAMVSLCLRPIKLFEKQLKAIVNKTSTNEKILLYESTFLSSELVGLRSAIQAIIAKNDLFFKKQIEKDGLSGLYNKVTTEKRISEYLENGGEGILFMIDVDNFKGVNDNLGHDFGDYVIKDVAYKLNSVFMYNDIIGRIGGDEFMVFIKNKNINIEAKGMQLCNAIATTYSEKDVEVFVSASVGIAIATEADINFKELYLSADAAMYESKKAGKNKFTINYDVISDYEIMQELKHRNSFKR
ncbi:hypothetical protein AN396_02770 [Candidatus Epulonipiscium fishelsonii]|uniref:Uncharacterized protein n=1 Tax=Candidatus Epulonipiscium fishelsonii TaxID=77094 RepID=A0ACC8XEW4_9FIRM|nr:hypothetical protein AN396_02770 [Epulopiscium sp. SCG-B11WGA-EpuloA1]